MEPNIKLGMGAYTDAQTERVGACINVLNEGTQPIQEIKVEFAYEFETPQDVAMPVNQGEKVIKFQEVGRSLCFAPAAGQSDGPLDSGAERVYLLPPEWTEQMRSLVQSLSPERYGIEITVDGKKDKAIPGPHWGAFVQRKFEPSPKDFTQTQVQRIRKIVEKVITLNGPFQIFPPKEVTDDPTVLSAPSISRKLLHTHWWIRFQDGDEEIVGYHDLLAITYDLRAIKQRMKRAMQSAEQGRVTFTHNLPVSLLLQPTIAQALVRSLTLNGMPKQDQTAEGLSAETLQYAMPQIKSIWAEWSEKGLGVPTIFILEKTNENAEKMIAKYSPVDTKFGWIETAIHPLSVSDAKSAVIEFLPGGPSAAELDESNANSIWVILVAFGGVGSYQIQTSEN
jgi:hypothetical protein